MPQRKLICRNPSRAHQLADKLAAHRPGRQFTVYGVQFDAYQVVEVRKFAGYGYRWDGSRWSKQHTPLPAPGRASVVPAPAVAVVTTVELPLHQETKAYIGVLINGAVAWFGRATLCAVEIADGMVAMTLPVKIAAQRGLA